MAESTSSGDASALLRFVPVAPGDFFTIGPGTPHAIGPGLTLVEPQQVLPGRRGLTYRYWDWNRRYDAEGRPDPQGFKFGHKAFQEFLRRPFTHRDNHRQRHAAFAR